MARSVMRVPERSMASRLTRPRRLATCSSPTSLLVACAIPGANAPAPRALPEGLAEDCFVAGDPCRMNADFDGDGRTDSAVLVARGHGEDAKRGLAILWGATSKAPLLLGAGVRTSVLQLADEQDPAAALAGAQRLAMDDDLSYLEDWGVLTPLPAFLPPGSGPGIKLSGSDSAWVVYFSRGGDVYFAPLGY